MKLKFSICIVLMLVTFSGCLNTGTDNLATNKRNRIGNAVAQEAFNAVLQVGLNVAVSSATNALAGQNGQDIAAETFKAAGQVDGAGAIRRVILAASEPNPGAVEIADAAAQQFTKVNPQTPAERTQLTNVIGSAIQLAANQQK